MFGLLHDRKCTFVCASQTPPRRWMQGITQQSSADPKRKSSCNSQSRGPRTQRQETADLGDILCVCVCLNSLNFDLNLGLWERFGQNLGHRSTWSRQALTGAQGALDRSGCVSLHVLVHGTNRSMHTRTHRQRCGVSMPSTTRVGAALPAVELG